MFGTPLVQAIIADLDACHAGDKDAYERIVNAFGATLFVQNPVFTPDEQKWIAEATERIKNLPPATFKADGGE